ncbi:MarR family winged helix-turn-helix transcriptional regulator [Glaciihabitans sp. dw_435]|uniref:MarR family winged helix-turn-helix transcriptional regulator n=1 Tax=Glaciihabitans sp. dw_435 TaxID=2720081 RepID=UPI001BD57ACF|nr:MarR family winged helix-turn-helix transcriptional regulator [Glaciihabitans sp. dw_435]
MSAAPAPDLSQIFTDLVRFQIELWNAVDARLRAEHGIPLGWVESMRIIDARENCRVFDIAEELVVTVGGTSKIVDRLEAAGNCVRRSNPDDRRSSIIELTPAGLALLATGTATYTEELRRRLGAVLAPDQLAAFGDTLTTLRAAGHAIAASAVGKLVVTT